MISGDADATRAVEAASAVVGMLAEIRRDPESYRSEFVLARQKVLEELLASVADSRALADRLVAMARYDLPDNYFDALARAVARMTLGDLRLVIDAELAADHQVFGAFGNAADVDAALDAARRIQH